MEKILIIGTSNSVMKSNYIESLKSKYNVVQKSCGRVPIFYHIKVLLENIENLKEYKFIILDHYVNDLNYYLSKFDSSYLKHVENYYKLLSSTEITCINLLFPILDIKKHKNNKYYEYIKKTSKNYNIKYIDMNNFDLNKDHYQDDIHMRKENSFIFGNVLCKYLEKVKVKNTFNKLIYNPYKIINFANLNNYKNKRRTFENSLFKFDYIKLSENDNLNLDLKKNYKICSMGYYNDLKDKLTTIFINSKQYVLTGEKYLHEAFIDDIFTKEKINSKFKFTVKLNNNLVIDPSNRLSTPYNVNDCSNYTNLVDIVLYDNKELKIESLTNVFNNKESEDNDLYEAIVLDFNKRLKNSFVDINNKILERNEPADILREIALSFESINDIQTAQRIMYQAHLLRPNGPVINKKLEEYKKILGDKK